MGDSNTPQAGAYGFIMPSLEVIVAKREHWSALVKMSANWLSVVKGVEIWPRKTTSLTKWQSLLYA